MAKRRGPKSKYWRNKADAAWSRAIRTLYQGRCAVCGDPGNHPHHLIGRKVPFTRHQLMNGICLCADHHVFNPRFSAHGCSVTFSEWLKKNDPERFNFVIRNKNRLKIEYDYEAVVEKLEAFLALSMMEMEARIDTEKELYRELG